MGERLNLLGSEVASTCWSRPAPEAHFLETLGPTADRLMVSLLSSPRAVFEPDTAKLHDLLSHPRVEFCIKPRTYSACCQ